MTTQFKYDIELSQFYTVSTERQNNFADFHTLAFKFRRDRAIFQTCLRTVEVYAL
jgi:hypothetical protein